MATALQNALLQVARTTGVTATRSTIKTEGPSRVASTVLEQTPPKPCRICSAAVTSEGQHDRIVHCSFTHASNRTETALPVIQTVQSSYLGERLREAYEAAWSGKLPRGMGARCAHAVRLKTLLLRSRPDLLDHISTNPNRTQRILYVFAYHPSQPREQSVA